MATPAGASGAELRPSTPFKPGNNAALASGSLPAAPSVPLASTEPTPAKRRLSDGPGGRRGRRSSSARRLSVEDKRRLLKAIVGRLVLPADDGGLIPLGELADRAVAAYAEAHGHPVRCFSPLLREMGFTVEELEVCKICGRRALKENCGGHYISRSVVWSPNSTKRKMVSARWKVDG